MEINNLDIDTIVGFINKMREENEAINFTSYFFNKWCKEHQSIRGLKNYLTAFRALQSFLGHEMIMHTEVTTKTLKSFEDYLSDRPRACSLYISSIMRVFNDMREYYNDEDNGIIRIKHTLSKFITPKQNIAEKRALSVEEIRKIFALPYDNKTVKGNTSRHDLALDCYRLSFALMGMNSADLFNATEFDGEYISYNRMKTKDRRNDKALLRVRVYPSLFPLIEKYRGKERVFNFYTRFKTMADFNRAINIGLKEIGKEIGVEQLQFYSARHSMATIAANDVKNPFLYSE